MVCLCKLLLFYQIGSAEILKRRVSVRWCVCVGYSTRLSRAEILSKGVCVSVRWCVHQFGSAEILKQRVFVFCVCVRVFACI